jgi:hypothetical protein
MRLWSWYKFVLVKHPLATKATTASGLMFVSDVLCQTAERSVIHHQVIPSEQGPRNKISLLLHGRTNDGIMATSPSARPDDHNDKMTFLFDSHDWDRSMHVAITGLTFSGPISHIWYGLLERLVTRSGIAGVVMKMILDAFLFSPVAVAGYFVWRTLLEGSGWIGTRRKLNTKWMSAVVASWSFWPATNIMYVSCVCVTCCSTTVWFCDFACRSWYLLIHYYFFYQMCQKFQLGSYSISCLIQQLLESFLERIFIQCE